MSGPHDLGGRHGFGPVPVGDGEIFTARWEARAFGVTQFAQVVAGFTTDAFRHGIEREHPDRYGVAYFDRWIRNAERMLVEGGVIGADAVAAHLAGRPADVAPVRSTSSVRSPVPGAARASTTQPSFAVGDRVRALEACVTSPARHSRLPGYAAGQVGTVAMVNGTWLLPDANAHGGDELAVWAYAVSFEASSLWPGSNATHRVHVDLFETYLEPA